MGWELLGGDPAPGSPESVGSAASALAHIADIAAQARQDLVTQTGAAGIDRWKGTAADAFRADVATLPGDLDTLGTSYRQASRALTAFRDALSTAQVDAGTALRLAVQAKADRDSAARRRDDAESDVVSHTIAHVRAEAELLALQTQQKLTIDPVQRAKLDARIATARTKVNRVAGDLKAAKQAVARYKSQVDDADRRLKDAHERANRIRSTISAAADTATTAIQTAEKEAHLPNWAQERLQRAGSWVSRNADTIKNVLSIVQTICVVASMVFPAAAPVLMTVSLVCAVTILATDVVKTANDPEGFSAANMWMLGGDLLNVVGSAAGLGAVKAAASASSGITSASTFATASKDLTLTRNLSAVQNVAGWGQDAARVGQGMAENGWDGGVTAAGTVLIGRVGAKAGGEVIRGVADKANRSPAISGRLDDMSRGLQMHDPAPNLTTTELRGLPSTTGIRSVLATGRQSDLGAQIGEKYAEELAAPVAQYAGDRLNEKAQPEIDINVDLHPSPYGGQQ